MEVIREFAPADRYLYDFKICTGRRGWAQVDTDEDAHYFGNWANPTTLELFSYCEGDTILTKCDNPTEFIREIQNFVEWQGSGFRGIDGMCDEDIIARFQNLGLGRYLH